MIKYFMVLVSLILLQCAYNGNCEMIYETIVYNGTDHNINVRCDECGQTEYSVLEPGDQVIYRGESLVVGIDKGNGETLKRPECEYVSMDCATECKEVVR